MGTLIFLVLAFRGAFPLSAPWLHPFFQLYLPRDFNLFIRKTPKMLTAKWTFG